MLGSVMIATNMAGRGIDIKLGGEMYEAIMRMLRRHWVPGNAGKDPINVCKGLLASANPIPAV